MAVRFLNQSHEYVVDFCEPQLNILAHAQAIELDVGSECGGHGICGKDRIRVSGSGLLSPPTQEEMEHLGEQELRAGVRLACQCFPEKDQELAFEVLDGGA